MKKCIIAFWVSLTSVFKKKVFTHKDNAAPIKNLLLKGDYRDLEIWETLDLFEIVREDLIEEMQKEKEKKEYDLAKIGIFLNKENILKN